MKFNLGAGKVLKEGFTGIDVIPYPGVDINLNLDDVNVKLPANDGSVEHIYSSHFLEHIRNIYPLLNECWRVLAKDGVFEAVVPLAPSSASFGDPGHIRFFTEETFQYFTKHPPGNYEMTELNGCFWEIILNDWTPTYTEDTEHIIYNKRRELHIIMKPVKVAVTGVLPPK